jgi:Leucine rich repeat
MILHRPLKSKRKSGCSTAPAAARRHVFRQPPTIETQPGTSDSSTAHVVVLEARNLALESFSTLSLSASLRLLNLSGNQLTSVTDLAACCGLIHLDLSYNSLTSCGDAALWSGMPQLTTLLLHHNPLSSYDGVRTLQSAPSLAYLTEHDTPLAGRSKCRQFFLNRCSKLLAVDRFAASDEELVEGSRPSGTRYAALTPLLAIPLPLLRALQQPLLCISSNSSSSAVESIGTTVHSEQHVVALLARRIAVLKRFQQGYCAAAVVQRAVRRHAARQRGVGMLIKVQVM